MHVAFGVKTSKAQNEQMFSGLPRKRTHSYGRALNHGLPWAMGKPHGVRRPGSESTAPAPAAMREQ